MTVMAHGDASITHEHPLGIAVCRHADGSIYSEKISLSVFLASINQTRRDCASHGLSVTVRQEIQDEPNVRDPR